MNNESQQPGSSSETSRDVAQQNTDENRVDPKLLELLVCPMTKTQLTFDREKNELVSKAAGVAFPIRKGIPLMTPDAARPLKDEG